MVVVGVLVCVVVVVRVIDSGFDRMPGKVVLALHLLPSSLVPLDYRYLYRIS
jgi:hypothetical protein